MSLKKAPLSLAELVGVRLSFSVTQFFRFAPAMGFTILVTIVFIADVKFVVAAFQLPCKQQRYDAKRYCNVDSDVRIATFSSSKTMLIQTFLFGNSVSSYLLCAKLENGQRNSNFFLLSGTISPLCPPLNLFATFPG